MKSLNDWLAKGIFFFFLVTIVKDNVSIGLRKIVVQFCNFGDRQ